MNITDIKSDSDNLIILQLYRSLNSESHIKEKKMNFQELCRWLAVFSVSDTDKYNSGLYLFAEMSATYRKNDNIINRTALVLDFDDLTPEMDIMGKFKEILKFSYVAHSSYNHTAELPRVRLIIPLDEPIEPKYYKPAIELIEKSLNVKCDPSSYTVSQAQAKGVKKQKESPYIFEYQDTHFMKSKNLVKILDDEISKTESKVITLKRSDDFWSDIAMGVGEGERNSSLASLIGLLFRRYIPKELVYGLAYSWAKQCNPPIEDKEINKTYKSIYKKHFNID
ncbi:hypothetical protein V070_01817 [Staphylococcus aureus C0673]|nr:hypothetical protein V070_01817 [Staphylococcus aureus C0673]